MPFVKIFAASLPVSFKMDPKDAFEKVIDTWKVRCHTVNRRLAGVALVERWDPRYREILEASKTPSTDVEIRKLIPRSPNIFSTCAYETAFWLDKCTIEFRPCVMDKKRHPHIPFPYRLVLEEIRAEKWDLTLCVESGGMDCRWLLDEVFPRLLKWFGEVDGNQSITVSHKLINAEKYVKLYHEGWTERTDPQKFVYEDCAIAAYLITYWNQTSSLPRKFCDIGCGNGLLVYLLQQMKIKGYGVDLRRRRIWMRFVEVDLKEKIVNPETDVIGDADFLIGNHTDELTPWIPIMAARSRSNFFLLPCCPFDFYCRFQRKSGMVAGSLYSCYLSFIRDICLRLGYHVEEDRLKIPSTRRLCFLCTVPAAGLVDNVENVINGLLSSVTKFLPRESTGKMRKCSQLSYEFRQSLMLKIFKHLLRPTLNEATRCSSWRRGRSCPLGEIANLLDDEEKAQLRSLDGGLQTFLKNQHQVFQVVRNAVSIRNWSEEGCRKVMGKLKTKDCWFYQNHPDGCPLAVEDCSYKH